MTEILKGAPVAASIIEKAAHMSVESGKARSAREFQ